MIATAIAFLIAVILFAVAALGDKDAGEFTAWGLAALALGLLLAVIQGVLPTIFGKPRQ